MSGASVDFETSEYLVVKDGEKVLFRCPIYLIDLGWSEAIDGFIVRHDGVEGTIAYLRKALRDDMRRSMGLLSRE